MKPEDMSELKRQFRLFLRERERTEEEIMDWWDEHDPDGELDINMSIIHSIQDVLGKQ